MEIQLRPYQSDFITSIKKSIQSGNKRIIAAAATGSGKAVCIVYIYIVKKYPYKSITYRVDKYKKSVCN